MRFHIDQDSGHTIVGWVVLDNPSASPEILVSMPGGTATLISANQIRPGLKDRGLHTTGIAGFRVNESNYPGLAKAPEIEIRESDTGILIYKRALSGRYLQRRLFSYELQVMPQPQYHAAFSRNFAATYQSMERYGGETLSNIISNSLNKSVYMTGTPLLIRYQPILRESGFLIVTILRDPFEELAEQLLLSHALKSEVRPAGFDQLPFRFRPILDCFSKINIEDDSSIAAVFRSLSTPQQEAISNPSVRFLACDVDESPEKIHVGSALDNLAAMDLVGLWSHYDEFKAMLQELLQVNVLGSQQPFVMPGTQAMVSRLARIREVRDLLALDLELYTYAKEAIENALKA